MPDLDGTAAARARRVVESAGWRRALAVVAMTANSVFDEGPACTSAGMDHLLAKPFGLTALRDCLAKIPCTGLLTGQRNVTIERDLELQRGDFQRHRCRDL